MLHNFHIIQTLIYSYKYFQSTTFTNNCIRTYNLLIYTLAYPSTDNFLICNSTITTSPILLLVITNFLF